MNHEPAVTLPDPQPLIESAESANVVDFPLRAPWTAEPSRGSRSSTIIAEDNVQKEVLEQVNTDRVSLDDVLPRHQFLSQLRREKRRTERSKAPLSIATFRLDGTRGDGLDKVQLLLRLLQDNKRETDILGCIDNDCVAIILPETNLDGMQGFMQKVAQRVTDLSFATSTATYPNELFESLATGRQSSRDLEPMFLDRSAGEPRFGYLLKRGVDVTGAMLGILILSPLMLITASAIAMTSPGPIIYKQVRLGKRGTPFVFYKFRSMFCSVDDRIHREYVTRLIEGERQEGTQGKSAKPWAKIQDDPRVTRVGQFIRKTSIDELPQLFNVLKGDLSLVGPRPPLSYEVEKYQSWHLRRILDTKPGITGLWQVEGGSHTTFDDMVRMDLRYVRHCSLMLDIRILVKTLTVVLRRGNAG